MTSALETTSHDTATAQTGPARTDEGGERLDRIFEELGEGEVRRESILLQLRQTGGMCYEELVALCGEDAGYLTGVTVDENGASYMA